MKKAKTRPFIMVDYETMMREDLSVYERSVYLTLCAYSNNVTAECYPSYQTIAEKSGCSKRTAIAAIAHLEALGLIEKAIRFRGRHYTSNIYTVCDAPLPEHSAPHAPSAIFNDAFRTPPGAGYAQGDAHNATKPDTLNRNQENNKSSYKEISYWKDKIEYDKLIQEMPDMLSVLEFVPGIVCDLAEKPFASELCADDVRAFINNRDDTDGWVQSAIFAPDYLKGCIREFLEARHGGTSSVYGT